MTPDKARRKALAKAILDHVGDNLRLPPSPAEVLALLDAADRLERIESNPNVDPGPYSKLDHWNQIRYALNEAGHLHSDPVHGIEGDLPLRDCVRLLAADRDEARTRLAKVESQRDAMAAENAVLVLTIRNALGGIGPNGGNPADVVKFAGREMVRLAEVDKRVTRMEAALRTIADIECCDGAGKTCGAPERAAEILEALR